MATSSSTSGGLFEHFTRESLWCRETAKLPASSRCRNAKDNNSSSKNNYSSSSTARSSKSGSNGSGGSRHMRNSHLPMSASARTSRRLSGSSSPRVFDLICSSIDERDEEVGPTPHSSLSLFSSSLFFGSGSSSSMMMAPPSSSLLPMVGTNLRLPLPTPPPTRLAYARHVSKGKDPGSNRADSGKADSRAPEQRLESTTLLEPEPWELGASPSMPSGHANSCSGDPLDPHSVREFMHKVSGFDDLAFAASTSDNIDTSNSNNTTTNINNNSNSNSGNRNSHHDNGIATNLVQLGSEGNQEEDEELDLDINFEDFSHAQRLTTSRRARNADNIGSHDNAHTNINSRSLHSSKGSDGGEEEEEEEEEEGDDLSTSDRQQQQQQQQQQQRRTMPRPLSRVTSPVSPTLQPMSEEDTILACTDLAEISAGAWPSGTSASPPSEEALTNRESRIAQSISRLLGHPHSADNSNTNSGCPSKSASVTSLVVLPSPAAAAAATQPWYSSSASASGNPSPRPRSRLRGRLLTEPISPGGGGATQAAGSPSGAGASGGQQLIVEREKEGPSKDKESQRGRARTSNCVYRDFMATAGSDSMGAGATAGAGAMFSQGRTQSQGLVLPDDVFGLFGPGSPKIPPLLKAEPLRPRKAITSINAVDLEFRCVRERKAETKRVGRRLQAFDRRRASFLKASMPVSGGINTKQLKQSIVAAIFGEGFSKGKLVAASNNHRATIMVRALDDDSKAQGAGGGGSGQDVEKELAYQVVKWSSQSGDHGAANIARPGERWESQFGGIKYEYLIFELDHGPSTVMSIEFGVVDVMATPQRCKLQYSTKGPSGPWQDAWRFTVPSPGVHSTFKTTFEYGPYAKQFSNAILRYAKGDHDKAYKLLMTPINPTTITMDHLLDICRSLQQLRNNPAAMAVASVDLRSLFKELDTERCGSVGIAELLKGEGKPPVAQWWRLHVLDNWGSPHGIALGGPLKLSTTPAAAAAAAEAAQKSSLSGGGGGGGGVNNSNSNNSSGGGNMGGVGSSSAVGGGSFNAANAAQDDDMLALLSGTFAVSKSQSKASDDGTNGNSVVDVASPASFLQLARKHSLKYNEVEEIYEQFESIDLDRDGYISKKEFEALLARVYGASDVQDLAPSRVEQFWKQVDPDNSGVSFPRFLKWQRTVQVTSKRPGQPLDALGAVLLRGYHQQVPAARTRGGLAKTMPIHSSASAEFAEGD